MEKQTEGNLRLLLSGDVSMNRSSTIGETAAARDERIAAIRWIKRGSNAVRHFFGGLCDPRFFSAVDESDYYLPPDQDDVWYPDKLAAEARAMRCLEVCYGKKLSLLVHRDMWVVDAVEWGIASPYVYYQKMSPAKRYSRQLLVQNNVTGGAILMNCVLVRLLVAHPMSEHAVMRDHWIVLVTAALGRAAYLDRTLYDYRQYGDNAFGAKKGSALSETRRRFGLAGESFKEVNEKSGAAYRAPSLQAEEFWRQYGKELSAETGKTFDDFLALQHETRVGRAAGTLYGDFTFSPSHRTPGGLLFL